MKALATYDGDCGCEVLTHIEPFSLCCANPQGATTFQYIQLCPFEVHIKVNKHEYR